MNPVFIQKLSNRLKRNLPGKSVHETMFVRPRIPFPEINYDKIDKIRGLDITICTSTDNNAEALELLKGFNMPFSTQETN